MSFTNNSTQSHLNTPLIYINSTQRTPNDYSNKRSLSNKHINQINQIEDLFQRADILMFKDRNYNEAEQIYRSILEIDCRNVDAMNSVAYCIKYRLLGFDGEGQNNLSESINNQVFELLMPIYSELLRIDPENVETNFNMGLLFLTQKQDLNSAINFFQRALKKDKQINNQKSLNPQDAAVYQQYQDVFRPQFIKSLYNIGMIYDRLGDIQRANTYYRHAINKCKEDKSQQSMKSSYYIKAQTNYAVTLEKLGKRQEAISMLNNMKDEFREDIRLFNNLGIIQKRNGSIIEAIECYENAIEIDSECFFPYYNLAVCKSSVSNSITDKEALEYFEKALDLARQNREEIYEVNVLVNMALIYERLDNIHEAIQCLEQALVIDDSNARITQKLQQLRDLLSKRQLYQQDSFQDSDKSSNQHLPQQASQQKLQQSQEFQISSQDSKKDEQSRNYQVVENQISQLSLEHLQINKNLDSTKKLIQQASVDEIMENTPSTHQNHNQSKNLKNYSFQSSEQMKDDTPQPGKKQQQRMSKQIDIRTVSEATNHAQNDKSTKNDDKRQHETFEDSLIQIVNTSNFRLEMDKKQEDNGYITANASIEGTLLEKKDHSQLVVEQETPKNRRSILQNSSQRLQMRSGLQSRQSNHESMRIDHAKLTSGLDTFLPKTMEELKQQEFEIKQNESMIQQSNTENTVNIEEQKADNTNLAQYYQEIVEDDQQNQISQEDIHNLVDVENVDEQSIEKNDDNKLQMSSQRHNDQRNNNNLDIDVQHFSRYSSMKQEEEDDYLYWGHDKCLSRIEKFENQEEVCKATFRLGLIQMTQKHYKRALEYFKQAELMGVEEMMVQIWIKIGEANYKMDFNQEALEYFQRAQDKIKPQEDYLISLFNAKCFDKLKQFSQCIKEYENGIQQCKQQIEFEDQGTVLGNIYFRLGWAYIRGKVDIELGIEHLRQACDLLPTNSEVFIKLASVLFREKGLIDEPLQLLEKAVKLKTRNADAYMLLGKLMDKKEENTKASEYFAQAIKYYAEQDPKNPPQPSCFFYLASSLEKAKEFKKCILNYKKCLTLDNKHFGASIQLANLLANLGEGQRAAKYFKHAIKIEPESINARFGLAKTLQQFSENKDAPIEHYELVIQKDPNHYKAYTQLGILFLDREEYEKSADKLKKALAINRFYPLALVSMGNLLFETGHADEAIKYHKQALVINNKELQALIGLGNAYYDSSQPKEAIQFYKRALHIDDQLSDVHYNLGNALYLIENIEEAIIHYRAAINLNPRKSESFYNLGNALCVKNDYHNAINSYHQALDLDPKNAPALYNLGNAYYMLNQFQDAIKVYLRALEINEFSAECHFNLASAYNDIANYAGAVAHYNRALELDDKNTDAFLCLGGVYETLKQFDKAEKYYRIALQREGDNVKALDALKKLKNSNLIRTNTNQ
ncbi:tpr domain containing protein [Stylonychia lemnae]|uniref:Tpr domain containing protein n=1 Tax=Stylonychia lemnae TaxID=5949 RepID=A0A078ACN2_STYLE|nr:tpr domain containing protein [Stylonychia lemnae]|eukprot:CDW79621.1 tpr domain containing protein [Stylonychia lemnae]